MATIGRMEKGNDNVVYCEAVVDQYGLNGAAPIPNATVTCYVYDEDNADQQVAGPISMTSDGSGSGNNYYGLCLKADTDLMVLDHLLRLEYLIDAGSGRYQKRLGWARVVNVEDDL